jgi:hypothetical protein
MKTSKKRKYSELKDENHTALNIYFDDDKQNQYGRQVSHGLDREVVFWSRERGRHSAKVTARIDVQYFSGDLSPLIAVFAGRVDAVTFVDAMEKLCNPGSPVFLPVHFDLTPRSNEIRNHFVEVKRFRTERLRDDREKRASISGINLEASDAWERYVRTMAGELTMVVVKYGETFVKIAEDGTLRFRAQSDDAAFVRGLILELRTLGIFV